ncbi:substrate-binding domain-containing protein [Neobacillus piezotolerans]|uniref:substrate-binding domain-containing protein n=1 Tax=Neobacillus piezotolerans TaxID=2259171 RepID=UPI001FE31D7B|nr:substrate-binding domain-containing protein [Neobacillus piezotolerans]
MKLRNVFLSVLTALLLIFNLATPSMAATPSTSKSTATASVVKKVKTTVNLNVRKGAGTNYGIIGTAKKGQELSVVQVADKWLKVKWNGKYGYVSKKYTKDVPVQAAKPAPKPASKPVATKPAPAPKPAPKPKLEGSITLATTTSTQDSGLLDTIIPIFEAKYNVDVKVIAVGTGQAIKMGEQGDADVILVHDRKSEDKFVSDKYGDLAYSLMYNQFLIVGPKDDPAKIKDSKTVKSALQKIVDKEAIFISRGDDSGTHKKELTLWKNAGITPEGKWYKKAGLGMGDTLRMADELGGYTLTDEATFLTNKTSLVRLAEGQDELLNPYGVIRVKSTKKPNASKAFIDFLVGDEGQKIIGKYGKTKFGKPLFVPNASKR